MQATQMERTEEATGFAVPGIPISQQSIVDLYDLLALPNPDENVISLMSMTSAEGTPLSKSFHPIQRMITKITKSTGGQKATK